MRNKKAILVWSDGIETNYTEYTSTQLKTAVAQAQEQMHKEYQEHGEANEECGAFEGDRECYFAAEDQDSCRWTVIPVSEDKDENNSDRLIATSIEWDTDGDQEVLDMLPKRVVLPEQFNLDEYLDKDRLLDDISDWLSDEYEYCHSGFRLEFGHATMTEETARKIAEEFIKEHNPNNWDGTGKPDKGFSTELEVYDVFIEDVYLVILFEIDADEDGRWAHFVKLYRKSDDQLIDGYHGYGIDSVQNMVDTIMDICRDYKVKFELRESVSVSPERVVICLEELFNHLAENEDDDRVSLTYGFLQKETDGDHSWFDLKTEIGTPCMDGEVCEIIEEKDDYIVLQELCEKLPFRLSQKEYMIAAVPAISLTEGEKSRYLAAFFAEAIANGDDETDTYGFMLEHGMDVEYVRKYAGQRTAEHMQKYCEEHGLL